MFIYTAVSNSDFQLWELIVNGSVTGEFTSAGLWSALDAARGEIIWQTPDPNSLMAEGAVTLANGVVYAGSLAPLASAATFFALDADTGSILWSFDSGGSVSGAAVVNGTVYWGSGYALRGTPNDKLYAFEVPKGP